jgi:hypothetical protein
VAAEQKGSTALAACNNAGMKALITAFIERKSAAPTSAPVASPKAAVATPVTTQSKVLEVKGRCFLL